MLSAGQTFLRSLKSGKDKLMGNNSSSPYSSYPQRQPFSKSSSGSTEGESSSSAAEGGPSEMPNDQNLAREWGPDRIVKHVKAWGQHYMKKMQRDQNKTFDYLTDMQRQVQVAHFATAVADDARLESAFANLQLLQQCVNKGHNDSQTLQKSMLWVRNCMDIIELILTNRQAFVDGSFKNLLGQIGLIDSNGTYVITVLKKGYETDKPAEQPVVTVNQEAQGEGEHNEEQKLMLCEICLERPRDCLLQPCNHFKYCGKCIKDYHSGDTNTCPCCRKVVESIVHDVFI